MDDYKLPVIIHTLLHKTRETPNTVWTGASLVVENLHPPEIYLYLMTT